MARQDIVHIGLFEARNFWTYNLMTELRMTTLVAAVLTTTERKPHEMKDSLVKVQTTGRDEIRRTTITST